MGGSALLRTWGFAVLGGALIAVALLVNLFAPGKRRRLRAGVFLYAAYLAAFAAWHVLDRVRLPVVTAWTEHVGLFCDAFAAFILVRLTTLVVFDLVLPAVGLRLVAITSDIVVGLAYVFAALGVMKAAGFSASSVVTTSAIVSGVLALGLQATLGNIVGGVALQLDGSVHVGDWVRLADGTEGKVAAIRWRHTVVETRNWDTVIVPNASLLAQNILLLGKRSGQPLQHRMWVYFNVDFRHPPTQVIDVVREALCAAPIEGVASEPKPSVICYDFAKEGRDSFGYYAVRYWLTDLASDDPTSSRIRARIYMALHRADIPLARPAQTVLFRPEEDEAVRASRHKERRVHALESVDLFRSLTPDERAFVADHLRDAPFAAGETCTKQGAVAHFLYVLVSGAVEIRRHLEGPPGSEKITTVAHLDAPGFFGEMGLMTGEPRTADVVAVTDVMCYRLDKPGLQRILDERPEIAEQFSETLARRRLDLTRALEGLDEAARGARMASEQLRILDKIQEFFGLARRSIA
jgi:small-conductance mechanosensitive channel/CRP-like cAMP-binding protein